MAIQVHELYSLLILYSIMGCNLLCWNVRGIMSSAYPLSQMLDDYAIDIALITEHKLLPYSSVFLNSIHQDYNYALTVDESISQYGSVRCGKAGTAIMYKKSIQSYVNTIQNIDCDRIIGIEIQYDQNLPTYIFCAYLPSDHDIETYREVISELQTLIAYYTKEGNVITAGDFNAQYSHNGNAQGNPKSKVLTQFVNDNNLVSAQQVVNYENGYTFVPTKATIDYIFVESSFGEKVKSFLIVNECEILTSDHLPLIMSFETEHIINIKLSSRVCTAWHKCNENDLIRYQNAITENLSGILENNNEYYDPDLLNSLIVDAVHRAETLLPRSKFNKRAKPYWCKQVKEAHTVARSMRRQWISAGRPRGHHHLSYHQYKLAKCNFRRIQRENQLEYENKMHDELNQAAELDYRLFWKLLKRNKVKPNGVCAQLVTDNSTFTGEHVVDGFAKHFTNVFKMEQCNTLQDMAKKQQLKHLLSDLPSTRFPELLASITTNEISLATKTLKQRKSPGCDNVLNEHILSAKHVIDSVLTKLFNSILRHEMIPIQWKTSILVPIYKGKGKSKTDANNYRPISLIPCFCKIFEKVLLNRIDKQLESIQPPFPNSQQHGFRKQLSCTTAAFNLQETIFHQIERNSHVYVAFLDQKSAFDCIWHDGLFIKLGLLGITGKILRLIRNSYTDLKCVVRHNGKSADAISVERSVRQGGTLSTLYYLVYVNQLLVDLENSTDGCSVMLTKSGNPSFADDITLIALSPLKLQNMIDTTYKYCNEWKMAINVEKSNVVVFSKKRNPPRAGILYGDSFIEQTTSAPHLGIRHDADLKLQHRIDERLQKAKNAFFAMSVQGVHPNGINPLTAINLYKRIVVPTALYGCELWNNMSNPQTYSVNKLQHFIVKRIQGFTTRTRSDICESMAGLHKLSADIEIRKLMFLHKLLSLSNNCSSKSIFILRYISFASDKRARQSMLGFIPDIIRILHIYGIGHIINDVLVNPMALPSKHCWKNLIKSLVYSRESDKWTRRVTADDEFRYFSILHPVISPAIVYTVYRDSTSRHIMRSVANIWARSMTNDLSVCLMCDRICMDLVTHVVSDCKGTYHLRSCFVNDLFYTHNSLFINNLLILDKETWTLKLLGAPIGAILDCDNQIQFLKRSYRYVFECMNRFITCM